MGVQGLAFEMVITKKDDFKLGFVGDGMILLPLIYLFSGQLKRPFRDYLYFLSNGLAENSRINDPFSNLSEQWLGRQKSDTALSPDLVIALGVIITVILWLHAYDVYHTN